MGQYGMGVNVSKGAMLQDLAFRAQPLREEWVISESLQRVRKESFQDFGKLTI